MSFTDGKPWIATEKDCNGPWRSGKNGKHFRCSLCGYKFKPGDRVRWQYTNDITGAVGNPLVCEKCDTTPEAVIEEWKRMIKEYDEKYWDFHKEEDLI